MGAEPVAEAAVFKGGTDWAPPLSDSPPPDQQTMHTSNVCIDTFILSDVMLQVEPKMYMKEFEVWNVPTFIIDITLLQWGGSD